MGNYLLIGAGFNRNWGGPLSEKIAGSLLGDLHLMRWRSASREAGLNALAFTGGAFGGITDGVQVNSVLPGPVTTARRRSYLQHWAPLHKMTVEEATTNFPNEAGIARYGEPEEIAELMAFLVSPGVRWMTGSTLRMDGGEVKSI
jgi:enoyl-[acyl-carrier-protein] reductase (NADH)